MTTSAINDPDFFLFFISLDTKFRRGRGGTSIAVTKQQSTLKPEIGEREKRERGRQKAGLPGLAFSRPKNKFVLFFKLAGFEIFDNLLSSWPFLSL